VEGRNLVQVQEGNVLFLDSPKASGYAFVMNKTCNRGQGLPFCIILFLLLQDIFGLFIGRQRVGLVDVGS
jgi:hypothetical protein